MASPSKRSFSLPAEQAEYIDAMVATGAYASASEVVRAGLRALQERDGVVEDWMKRDVLRTHDAMQANPARAIPAAEVFAALRARHVDGVKKAKRGA